MSDQAPASGQQLLPADELFVLCHWSVQAVAADLGITDDEAFELMASAHGQDRVRILGNSVFAGVQVDGAWVVVESRARITEATHQWQTLRFMRRQFDD